MNNRSSQPTEVTLIFHTKGGRASEPVKITVQPGEVKHLDVEDLLPAELKHQRELGGQFIQYSGQWNQIASQLTLISADRKSSMDEPLRPDGDFRSGVQDAVWHMPREGDAVIVLGNTTGDRASAVVTFPDGGLRDIRLGPYETEVTAWTANHLESRTGRMWPRFAWKRQRQRVQSAPLDM